MEKIKKRYFYIITAIAVTIFFIGVFINSFSSFSDAGREKSRMLGFAVQEVKGYIEILTIYGEKFLDTADEDKLSEYYGQIEYYSGSDRFALSSESFGTLSGVGGIPESGRGILELNMALSYYDFFRGFYESLPDVSWLYYTSESGYIYVYPELPEATRYSEEYKEIPYYLIAIPANNPDRLSVWSQVYLDAAGEGLMVTLSSPVYDGDDFMGVLSADLKTNTLRKLLAGKFDSFVLDSEGSVIATGQNLDFSGGVKHLHEILGVKQDRLGQILNIESGSIGLIGSNYYYKFDFADAPWTLIMEVSLFNIAGGALLLSLPVFVIGLLFLAAMKEVEKRKIAEEAARSMAITDELTGLNNRFYLDSIIEKAFQHANRYDEDLSVISFDLDHFKKVNDNFGHDIGDEVLRRTAQIAKSMIRESDSIIRMGGEEFLILLPKTDSQGAYLAADKIRRALEETAHPVSGVCTASFGVARMIRGETYSNLYRRADEALYMAKENGRNCIFSYEAIGDMPINSVIVKWEEDWNSGNETIDRQHRELVDIANDIMVLSLHLPKSIELGAMLNTLIKHLEEHFIYEEQVMEELACPLLEEHRATHIELLEKMFKMNADCLPGKLKTTECLSFTVKEAIIKHMLEDDRKYFPYLHFNGNKGD